MNYEKIAFTDAVRKLQELHGSRQAYERIENQNYSDGFTEQETAFIADRDSFYLASVSENGYPYMQHRGGPKGFIKVLDDTTLGLVDFSGNKQYITVGNIQTNSKVSLFFMDYRYRMRLKMFANMSIIEINQEPELFKLLDPSEYKHKPERMMIFSINGYSWNCSQHITPRYTLEEIELASGDSNT